MNVEDFTHNERDLTDDIEPNAGGGIKVDAEFIGVIDVISADGPGIEVDTAEVHRPDQVRRFVAHREIGGAPAGSFAT